MKKHNFKKTTSSVLMLAGLVATPVVSVLTSAPVSATTVAYGAQVTPTGWHDPDGKISASWSTATYSSGVQNTVSVSSAMVGDSITYQQLVGLNEGVGVATGNDKVTFGKLGDTTQTITTASTLNYTFTSDGFYSFVFTDANGAVVTVQLTVLAVNSSYPLVQAPATPGTMFRLYNPNSGEHFYTASAYERDSLVKNGWNSEGTAWVSPTSSNTPVFRLYNPNAGDHFYTTNASERDGLVSKGWKYEGIGWYSDDAKTVAVYRAYNPNAATGTHNYTTGTYEQGFLVAKGWTDEGIAWYATSIK